MSSDQELLTLLNNRISKATKLIKEKQGTIGFPSAT